ncbi:precorrin-6Y C5,15-methyltransferase (decarboxylating) subunit CbiT [Calderihabitans maritimus]|nr:precorrin-6Y C5,15-methyltransferase (decarboxylating) subunit CbiT [Calderihabitans maritimus]
MQDRRRKCTPGIKDEEFCRGQVPMTKEEIRVLLLSKACLEVDNTIYDVGAGTGSIAVEAALLARRGKIFAVEKEPEGINLIRRNAARFGVTNLEVVAGEAPDVLEPLPPADRIFLGGSGGNLNSILETCDRKLRAGGIIVISAVTLNTLLSAYQFLDSRGYRRQIVMVNVARLERLGGTEAFRGLNPVYIISGVKEEKGER